MLEHDGVFVFASGYGSAIAMGPTGPLTLYLLTDRGPNIDFPGEDKGFPVPDHGPELLKGRYQDGKLEIESRIPLRLGDGTRISGIPIGADGCGGTGEAAFRLDGTPIPPNPHGLDSEGLVVDSDGSFWISDEYGPFLVRFSADGREQVRWSPCNGGLPAVYASRRPNRGMEGLTITPDRQWLVGIMQAPLEHPSPEGIRNQSRLVRILFKHVDTGETREYGYLLDDPTAEGISEILALSATEFLVIERDEHFLRGTPPAVVKRIYRIGIGGATELSDLGRKDATPVGGKTLEQASVEELARAGIVPVTKVLAVDLASLGYPHDKPEGLALLPDGTLLVSNDDDFGVATGKVGVMIQKLLPGTDTTDFVELYPVRLPK